MSKTRNIPVKRSFTASVETYITAPKLIRGLFVYMYIYNIYKEY
nr:MAG TPA: hypothetical protein [Caudoviricetes sp.]